MVRSVCYCSAGVEHQVIRRVLLTGGNGFVGRQVLKALLASGVNVRLVLRNGRQVPEFAQDLIDDVLRTDDLFAEHVEWWKAACSGIDTVVHVAWYAEPGKYLKSDKNIDCLSGTLSLARGAVAAGVCKFVGVGTCFEYELGADWLTVDTPLKPVTLYAATKASAYLTLSQWLPAESVEFAWCRLFYLYGEGEDPRRLVPYLRERLAAGLPADLTSGNQIRDFMDVSEAGRQISEVALGDMQGARNICSGVPVTVRGLAERVADEYGRRDLLRFGARPDNEVDPPRVVGVRHESE